MSDFPLPSKAVEHRVSKIREDLEAIIELQEMIELPSQEEADRLDSIHHTVRSLAD